ncbi:MAG: hypothetical protein ABFD89_12120 [Bryobacteraceae bacterium]
MNDDDGPMGLLVGDSVDVYDHAAEMWVRGTIIKILSELKNPVCVELRDGRRFWRKHEEVREI